MYLNGVRLDADRLQKRTETDALSRVTFNGTFLGVGRIINGGELVSVKQFRPE